LATAPEPRARAAGVKVRALRPRERERAMARLRARPRDELFLMDLVARVGVAATAEADAEVLGAWRGDALVGVASMRPTVAVENALEPQVLAALLDSIAPLAAGLVRSPAPIAAPLWERLEARGRRALVDRSEISLVLEREGLRPLEAPAGARVRPARSADLERLVEAARASLREEGRPDPFLGDPRGFRRWVAARESRALVVEGGGRVAWVGYADVRLPEGWLLQGVYTWPEARRRGLAAAGVTELCRHAFAAGVDHVQLAVVDGNAPAAALYGRLGFRPHAVLRTLLFA
jgi:RimJ/RimL family protein N-acetyltransferase